MLYSLLELTIELMSSKTSIAVEFAHLLREERPRHVLWIYASNLSRVEQSYRNIAQAMKLPGFEDPGVDSYGLVLNWLRKPETGPSLIVIDNADDGEVFNTDDLQSGPNQGMKFFPHGPSIKVLVTTQSKHVAAKLCNSNTLEVLPLSLCDSKDLLELHMMRRVEAHEPCEDLISCLEYLPFAITRAGAFINHNDIRIQDYLELIRRDQTTLAKLMMESHLRGQRTAQHSSNIKTICTLSFDQIQRENSDAMGILALMSVFDRQKLPRSLLTSAFALDALSLIEALGCLKAFHLISSERENDTLTMHSLVQTTVQYWLKSSGSLESWRARALSVMASNFPICGSQKHPERLPLGRAYFPYAETILQHRFVNRDDLINKLALLRKVAGFLSDDFDDKKAEHYYSVCVELGSSIIGPEHLGNLYASNSIGFLIARSARYDEAEEIYRKNLELLCRIYGDDHPATVACHSDLANVLAARGEYTEAEKLYSNVLATQTKLIGKNNLDHELLTMNNLAINLSLGGKFSEAEKMLRKVIYEHREQLGRKHPLTLRSYFNLGLALSDRGKYEEAVEILSTNLETFEETLRSNHVLTMRACSHLGWAYLKLDRLDKAEPLICRALDYNEQQLGPSHPDTLTSMYNLSVLRYEQGALLEALSLSQETIQHYTGKLGPTHPGTLKAKVFMSKVLRTSSRYEECETMQRLTLADMQARLGPRHPDTLTLTCSLACTLERVGTKLEEARELARRAVEGGEEVLGPEHPNFEKSRRLLELIEEKIEKNKERMEKKNEEQAEKETEDDGWITTSDDTTSET